MEYGLIGEKLGHSYSKIIHEKLADYTYELIPLSEEKFKTFMEKREFKGINVTIPYKRAVMPYLDEIDENAKNIGSVNTIVQRDSKLYGYNTDYYGFLYTLEKNSIVIEDKKVLVLGNGGSAQAVFSAIRCLKPKEMLIVKYKTEPGTITYDEAARLHTDADIIINTSPVGMYPNTDASPCSLTPYKNLSALVDLIYNPPTTMLLAQAEVLGAKAVNGLQMLVAQAKYAAEYFLDKKLSDDRMDFIYQELLQSMKDTKQ